MPPLPTSRRAAGPVSPPPHRRPGAVLRAAAFVAAGLVLAAATAAATAHAVRAVEAQGPASLDDVLVLLSAAGIAAVVLWWSAGAVVVGLAAVHRATGRGSSRWEAVAARCAPRVVHRLAAGLLGAGLVGGAAAPALAAQPSAAQPSAAQPSAAAPAAAVPLPTDPVVPATGTDLGWPAEGHEWRADPPPAVPRVAQPTPLGLAAPTRSAPEPAGAPPQADVVVRRGDTLWDLAARSLPAGTSDAEVAAEWPRWWQANRDVIGADPDLLVPGQLLHAPGADR